MGKMKLSEVQVAFQKCLFVGILLFTSTYGSPLQCCKPGIGLKNNSIHCTDGSRINLNCDDVFEANYNDDEEYILMKLNYEKNADDFCESHVNGELTYLICLPGTSEDSGKLSLKIFYGLCGVISSIFLALTLIVYLNLPQLRELQDKAMMSLCAAFMVAFFINGTQKLNLLDSWMDKQSSCIFIGLLMYYSFLSAFFWLNVISFNICKILWLPDFNVRSTILFTAYSIFAWGIPLCFLIFALVMDFVDNAYIKPGFGETCWFDGNLEKWLFFYGPISVLLTVNLIYLGLTSWKLWHQYGKLNSSNVKVLRVKCLIYAQLSLMMGATWIFEVISSLFKGSNLFYWIVTDTLNSLQGLLIFCLFVLQRKKVKKLLALRRPCNIPFPKKWTSCEDEEEWNENDPDNIQLTNTLL